MPISVSRLFVVLLCLSCGAQAVPPNARRVVRPAFRTEIVQFEDTFLYGTPTGGSLIYRTDGPGAVRREVGGDRRGFYFASGQAAVIHAAQYARATLRLHIRIERGEPGIAISNNGMRDRTGRPNTCPGVEVAFRTRDTLVRDLISGRVLAVCGEALPRKCQTMVAISWDHERHIVRIDLPKASWEVHLLDMAARGGFALRCPARPTTSYSVSGIQVLWQDQRDVVLYDGYDTVYDLTGRRIGRLPTMALPPEMTAYATAAVDLQRERSLILFGGTDLNSDHPDTIKGYAVRELRTGKLLDVFGPRINDCQPQQGGGALDGYWLLQSWNVPASLSWIDWNAYSRGDKAIFVTPYKVAVRDGAHLTGFHDPSNALDGSLCRYLRITETWVGVNHLAVHPNLADYAPFDDVAFPPPTDPRVSHTGPAGLPTQLVVRDRDRAWYEQWAYNGNALHTQCRGYNLFARTDDWHGPMCPVEKDAAAYTDYANMAPDLLQPGLLYAPLYRFTPTAEGAARVAPIGVDHLRWGAGRFVPLNRVSPGAVVPFQILMERNELLP